MEDKGCFLFKTHNTLVYFYIFNHRFNEIFGKNNIFHFRAFDVELLKIARSLEIPIVEVPVNWTEIEGSKVTPVLSWIEMAVDLALIWLRYTIGAWKIKAKYD